MKYYQKTWVILVSILAYTPHFFAADDGNVVYTFSDYTMVAKGIEKAVFDTSTCQSIVTLLKDAAIESIDDFQATQGPIIFMILSSAAFAKGELNVCKVDSIIEVLHEKNSQYLNMPSKNRTSRAPCSPLFYAIELALPHFIIESLVEYGAIFLEEEDLTKAIQAAYKDSTSFFWPTKKWKKNVGKLLSTRIDNVEEDGDCKKTENEDVSSIPSYDFSNPVVAAKFHRTIQNALIDRKKYTCFFELISEATVAQLEQYEKTSYGPILYTILDVVKNQPGCALGVSGTENEDILERATLMLQIMHKKHTNFLKKRREGEDSWPLHYAIKHGIDTGIIELLSMENAHWDNTCAGNDRKSIEDSLRKLSSNETVIYNYLNGTIKYIALEMTGQPLSQDGPALSGDGSSERTDTSSTSSIRALPLPPLESPLPTQRSGSNRNSMIIAAAVTAAMLVRYVFLVNHTAYKKKEVAQEAEKDDNNVVL